jgi:hypothetical protein
MAIHLLVNSDACPSIHNSVVTMVTSAYASVSIGGPQAFPMRRQITIAGERVPR